MGEPQRAFEGLIQHSFALRIGKDCQHFRGRSTHDLIKERFSRQQSTGAGFQVRTVGELATKTKTSMGDLSPHSLLVRCGFTTVQPQGIAFLERHEGQYKRLPKAFSWAGRSNEESEARMIFSQREQHRPTALNDFLVEGTASSANEQEANAVSRVLLQIVAHQRSLLFGLALANRLVNVMLPHALLRPASGDPRNGGCWLLQPLVSLILTGHEEGDRFRRMYTLTLFLIPVDGCGRGARAMPRGEIKRIVNANWSLASSRTPKSLPRFHVEGPLRHYLPLLERAQVPALFEAGNPSPGSEQAETPLERSLTLRQVTEPIMLAVALKMGQGPTGHVEKQARLWIGEQLLTSLVSAHVSSVVVVDRRLNKQDIKQSKKRKRAPGSLEGLMNKLAEDVRIPKSDGVARRRRYRLDRAYFDPDCYTLGVLPSSRCLVMCSASDAQRGRKESALMQAGWVAYMTIGAASAIGTMRAIDLDLERLEGSDPSKVADVEREVTVGLHEIYDLDITQESYRHLYRLLRKRLGITNDYKALMEKMQALYRETTARHEARAQARLLWLTAAIVTLSLLILIGTIVLAMK